SELISSNLLSTEEVTSLLHLGWQLCLEARRAPQIFRDCVRWMSTVAVGVASLMDFHLEAVKELFTEMHKMMENNPWMGRIIFESFLNSVRLRPDFLGTR